MGFYLYSLQKCGIIERPSTIRGSTMQATNPTTSTVLGNIKRMTWPARLFLLGLATGIVLAACLLWLVA